MSNSILSRPCSYAIRAVVHLGEQPAGRISSSREICQQENIPPLFLGKVLLPLCRCRMVRSLRGTGGGYELAVPAEGLRLIAIVRAIDGSRLDDCGLEDHPCGNPCECLLHPIWDAIRKQFVDFLERTTVADLVRTRRSTHVQISVADDRAEVIPTVK